MSDLIPVLVAPLFDPGSGRIAMALDYGKTVAEIVAAALPAASFADLGRLRVVLTSPAGAGVAEPKHWSRIRPKPGVSVIIRLVPGKDVLKSVLTIVVTIAAVALGQYWVAPLLGGGIAGAIGGAVVAAGISVLGNLLINALIPPPKTKTQNKSDTYQITGWNNRLDPDGVVPDVTGKIRFSPPFAVPPYTEIVGDIAYIRCVFDCGYGGQYGLAMSGFRIGDTSAGDYDAFQMEQREGLESDAPLTLVTQQVIEEKIGAELARPKPRDDAGNINESGSGIETPVIRTTGRDASGFSIIIGFSGGLVSINSKNGNSDTLTVQFRIRQRPTNTSAWQDVEVLTVSAAKLEGFYRQYTRSFPSRGAWDIEVTRLTDETTSTQQQSRSTWLSLQTLRPEYPLNLDKPRALIAVRVKSTYQLNGTLDNFNLLGSKRVLDWDSASQQWVVRESSNPASVFRYVLQTPANPKALADSKIDLQQLQSWHEYCSLKGLKYDAVQDQDRTLRDALTEIAAAGRATQRRDGVRWGVIVDRPQELIVDEVNSRNSWNFSSSRTYLTPPDGVWVSFLDATNDYKPAKRFIPWPGFSGDPRLTEMWDAPGKTDPAEVYREIRRRMHETVHRPDTYNCSQDGSSRTATRGDRVAGSFPVIERTQVSARVKALAGNMIILDELVTMLAGRNYAIRFRVISEDNVVGTSILRSLQTVAGEGYRVIVTGSGSLPQIGDLVHFGEALNESLSLIVTRVEQGQRQTSVYKFVDAAPIIDELTDAEVIPAWSGRVGDELSGSTALPPTPKFTSVKSGFTGTGTAGALAVLLTPGSGAIISASFRFQHRLATASVWNTVDFPAGNGGVKVEGYNTGDPVQIRAAAISPSGQAGEFTNVISHTVGANDAGLPAALDSSAVTIGAMPGGAMVMFSTSDDAATSAIQLYRSTVNVLDRATDAIGNELAVTPSRSFTVPDGDTTRTNLLGNAGFDDGAVWDLGSGWSIAAGKASHLGASSDLKQALAFTAGKYYRVAYTISDTSAGNVKARLLTGTVVDGTAQTANGNVSDRLQAVAGNDSFGFRASSSFDGSIDNALVFLETETCLPAGTHYYWLEPRNVDGVAGPAAGPFSVTIR